MVFATLVRRKPVDWNKVKSVLAKEDFVAVNDQRARHLELNRILATPIPKLDLSAYKDVMENQALVAEIESTLKSFKPASANVEPVLKTLQEQRVSALQKAKETVDHVTKTVAGFKSDLEAIKNIKNYSQVHPEHVYEASPGLEGVYHDRLRKGKVYHDDHNFGEKFLG